MPRYTPRPNGIFDTAVDPCVTKLNKSHQLNMGSALGCRVLMLVTLGQQGVREPFQPDICALYRHGASPRAK